MDFKQLSCFVAAVEEGSISAAARKLFLTQPPVTAQIQALEKELGCPLLLRGARAVRPTEEGRLLYDRAKALLALRQSAEEEIQTRVRQGGGTLRLGAVSSVADTLLPEYLAGFQARRPLMRYELSEENTYHLLDRLRAGIIELALVRTPFAGEGLRRLPLRRESLAAVGRRGSLPERGDVTLAELAARPLLLYRRWEQVARRLFAEKGLEMEIRLKADGADTVAAMAARGLGVGLLPESAAAAHPELSVCRIEGGAVGTAITAVCPAHARLSPAAQAFWEYLEETGAGGAPNASGAPDARGAPNARQKDLDKEESV